MYILYQKYFDQNIPILKTESLHVAIQELAKRKTIHDKVKKIGFGEVHKYNGVVYYIEGENYGYP